MNTDGNGVGIDVNRTSAGSSVGRCKLARASVAQQPQLWLVHSGRA
jgi:hypothetical protein